MANDIKNLTAAQRSEVAAYYARTQIGISYPPSSAEQVGIANGYVTASRQTAAATSKALDARIRAAGGDPSVVRNQQVSIATIEALPEGADAINEIRKTLPPNYPLPSTISVNDIYRVTNEILDTIAQQSLVSPTSVPTRPTVENSPITSNPQSTIPTQPVIQPAITPSARSKSSGVSSFIKGIAKGTINNLLGGGPNGVGDSSPQGLKSGIVQDWTHATKVFVGGDMARMPKYKGMFHVKFVLNPQATSRGGLGAVTDLIGKSSDTFSVLTKSVEMPKFSMDYSTLNQYNKASYSYKKIKYDPITITFHDDMSDIVTTFWYFYYAYYFADGSKQYTLGGGGGGAGGGLFAGLIKKGIDVLKNKVLGGITKFFNKGKTAGGDSAANGGSTDPKDPYENFRRYANGVVYSDGSMPNNSYSWGLNGSPYHINGHGNQNIPFLQAIEIYPLGLKQASVIVLQNPKIVSWTGDTFDYSAQGTATCSCSLVYEGVAYKDQIDAKTVLDDVAMYDRHGAPSSGKTGGFFSFIDKVDGILGKASRNEAIGVGDLSTVLGALRGGRGG